MGFLKDFKILFFETYLQYSDELVDQFNEVVLLMNHTKSIGEMGKEEKHELICEYFLHVINTQGNDRLESI